MEEARVIYLREILSRYSNGLQLYLCLPFYGWERADGQDDAAHYWAKKVHKQLSCRWAGKLLCLKFKDNDFQAFKEIEDSGVL